MVDIDNKPSIENDKALEIIQTFFSSEFKEFKLIELVNNDSRIGFRIVFEFENKSKIIFSGSWRGLEYEIFVSEKQYSLISYDERIKEAYSCSEKNVKSILLVMKNFLKEHALY